MAAPATTYYQIFRSADGATSKHAWNYQGDYTLAGAITTPGAITAGGFTGPLAGNASTATVANSVVGNAIGTAQLADNTVTTAKIVDGTILGADINQTTTITAASFVGPLTGNASSATVANGLASNAVTTAMLLDSSVTTAKILDGTILAADIATGTITGGQVADQSLGYGKLADLAIGTSPTTLVLTVSGTYINSLGILKTLVGATATLAATAATQWIPIYATDAGALATGTIGATRDASSYPLASATPLGTAFLPVNATGIYINNAAWAAGGSSATKGWVDARPAGVAAIAPTSGILSSSTLFTVGLPASSGDTGGVSGTDFLRNNVAPATVNGVVLTNAPFLGNQGKAAISTGATDANLAQMQRSQWSSFTEIVPSSMVTVSGAVVTVAQYLGAQIAGRDYSNEFGTETITLTGGAGLRHLYVDPTAAKITAGNQLGLVVTTSTFLDPVAQTPPLPPAGRKIGIIHWDGAIGDLASIDLALFGVVSTTQHRLGAIAAATPSGGGTNLVNSTNMVYPNTFTPLLVKRTKSMSYKVEGAIRVNAVSVAGTLLACITVNPIGGPAGGITASSKIGEYTTWPVAATVNGNDFTIPVGPTIWTPGGAGQDYLAPTVAQFLGAPIGTCYWAWLTVTPSAP